MEATDYSKTMVNTRWFKYDRDKLWLVYTQIVPVIFEPPCSYHTTRCHIPNNSTLSSCVILTAERLTLISACKVWLQCATQGLNVLIWWGVALKVVGYSHTLTEMNYKWMVRIQTAPIHKPTKLYGGKMWRISVYIHQGITEDSKQHGSWTKVNRVHKKAESNKTCDTDSLRYHVPYTQCVQKNSITVHRQAFTIIWFMSIILLTEIIMGKTFRVQQVTLSRPTLHNHNRIKYARVCVHDIYLTQIPAHIYTATTIYHLVAVSLAEPQMSLWCWPVLT
jgi:hypothetical protein